MSPSAVKRRVLQERGIGYWERKKRLPHGANRIVAAECGVSEALASAVNKGQHEHEAVERCFAAKMRPRTSRREAFGPAAPKKIRKP